MKNDEKTIIENIDESEERYKIAFKNNHDAITISDLNGEYLEVNQGFSDILEYEPEEVMGKTTTELNIWVNIKDRDKLIIPLKKYGHIENIEADFRSKSGKIKRGLLSAQIIVIKGIPYTLAITRDISQRVKIENKLKKVLLNEQELANIVRNAPTAIAIGYLNGKVSNFNQAAINLLGYSKKELETINWFKLTPPKWYKLEEKKLKELAITKKSIIYEKEYIKKDGTIIPIEMHVSGIFNKNGDLEKFIGFATDITERKKLEQTILNNQLLKTIGEMASAIAHDFNNSLQALSSNIELLKLMSITKEIKKHLDIMESITNDTSERVKSLQRLGDKKQDNSNFKIIKIDEILNEVISQTRPLWKGEKEKDGFEIKIEKNYQKNLKIYGNIGELRSVFYNLIKNAIEAIPKNGIIKIIAKKLNNHCVINIVDDGIGMTQETKNNLFQPFYSTKGFGLGRGLGMMGVLKVINKHSASIEVSSKKNIGTKITIKLPCQKDIHNLQGNKNNLNKVLVINKDIKILLVDDEDSVRLPTTEILKKIGYNIISVSNGIDALNKLNQEKFDIVITDIGMPKMSGWELIKKIRNNQNIKNIEIIILTGWAAEITKDLFQEHKIFGILEKPVKVDIINKLLSKVSKLKS